MGSAMPSQGRTPASRFEPPTYAHTVRRRATKFGTFVHVERVVSQEIHQQCTPATHTQKLSALSEGPLGVFHPCLSNHLVLLQF